MSIKYVIPHALSSKVNEHGYSKIYINKLIIFIFHKYGGCPINRNNLRLN